MLYILNNLLSIINIISNKCFREEKTKFYIVE